MLKHVISATLALCLILEAAPAKADRVQLPSDPDVTVSVGAGTFFGYSRRYEFRRIQPLNMRLELTGLNRGIDCRWFCRLNLYGALNPENTGLGYHDDLAQIGLMDDEGNTIIARKSGVTGAQLESGIMWGGGFGARLSVLDLKHFHLDLYAEYARSLADKRATVKNLDVHALLTREGPDGTKLYGGEIDLDATGLAQDYGTVTFGWAMTHVGATLAFPMRPKRLDRHRLTPYLQVGYVWLSADVSLKVDKELLDDLANFGVKPEDIPSGRQIRERSFSGSLGVRYEVNRNNAFEANGTFIYTGSVMASWITASYSLRFDYPWN
jgi:hypothetical protein